MKSILRIIFACFCLCFAPVLSAQVQVAPFLTSRVQFSNASGAAPCNGCLLDTFAAGTTNTLATYSESTGTTPNANPVVLASDGSAVVYLTNASYKFRLRTAAGATLWTQDSVTWSNLAQTLNSLALVGNATINSSTAATNVANQSGPTLCMDGNFWNGSASAVDSWCWNDVLGTGTNPTSTLTLVHSGSSATPIMNIPALLPTFSAFSRDVRADGVKADGSTDDSTAFNLSITNADGNKQGHIMLPCGAIKVNSAINLTNKNGLTLEGCASDVFDFGTPLQSSEIDCNTGGICIDLTGSSNIRLKNISLKMANAFTNPSTVGILDGRDNAALPNGSGQFCFSQYNTLENVNIISSSNPALNGGRGYIGIYDIGGEHFIYPSGKVQTDDPLVFATTNVLSISSPYQTIATGCPASMSGVMLGDVSVTPLSWTGGSLEIWNGVEFDLGFFECTMGTTAGQCVVTEGTLVNQVKGHIHVETPTANGSCLGINATTNNNLFLFCNVGGATGSAAYVNFDSNNLTVNDSSVWAVNETGTAQLMFGNAATGSAWNGGHIDLGNSLSPLSLSNLTLTGTVVQARAFTSGNVTFSGTSQYGLFASDGTKLIGNIAVNTAPITSTGFVIKGSNQTGNFQQGLQVFPTLSGTSQSIGIDIQANVAASITQGLNAGVIVETPTINAGGVITEWDGVRVSAAPTAGTQCSVKLFGSTSGSTCFNPTATASGVITFPAATGTVALAITATSAAFATATTAGTCVQSTTAVAGATTAMAATASPVSTPGVGAVWSAFVSSAGNVTINECAVAASAGGSIAFNIRVTP